MPTLRRKTNKAVNGGLKPTLQKMILTELKGIPQLQRDFKILTLSPDIKKKINFETVKAIRKNMMAVKKKEQTPDGKNWTPRKAPKEKLNKKGKLVIKKMLERIHVKSRSKATDKMGKFDYNNYVSAKIAAEHQEGAILPIKGKKEKSEEQQKAENATSSNSGKGGADIRQALTLLDLGFNEPKNPKARENKKGKNTSSKKVVKLWVERMMKNGKSRKKSSHQYIMNNISYKQARALIYVFKNEHKAIEKQKKKEEKARKKNERVLPSRPFLDTDPDRNAKRMEEQIDKAITKKL